MHKYYVFTMVIICFVYSDVEELLAAQSATIKNSCVLAFEKLANNTKIELLEAAKRSAIGEIFGEQIRAFTKIQDFALQKDVIENQTVGLIRLQGDPQYYQGENWGEVCVQINAYATEEGFEKFKPIKIGKKTCVMEGDVRKIKEQAEHKSKLEALIDYDGNLRKYPPEQIFPLLHKVEFSETGFVPGTSVYCIKSEGLVYPIEVQAFGTTGGVRDSDSDKQVKTTEQDSSTTVSKEVSAKTKDVNQGIVKEINENLSIRFEECKYMEKNEQREFWGHEPGLICRFTFLSKDKNKDERVSIGNLEMHDDKGWNHKGNAYICISFSCGMYFAQHTIVSGMPIEVMIKYREYKKNT